jgi:glutamate synthase (NADPH/NADH) large chain
VLNVDGKFAYFCNMGMVELTPVMEQEDQDFIQTWLQRHVEYTGSTVAQMVLENWYDYMPRFIKVLPLEYKRVLQERKLQEVDQQLALIRDEAMLGVAY